MTKSVLKVFLKEPLLHFVLIGGALFALSSGWSAPTLDATDVVHITSADMERLATLWARQWNRAPSDEERQGLMHDYLKETLLAREAVALGLDQNDIIVQRRLAQKMKFLLEDTVRIAEPGEAVLRDFYNRHPDRFMAGARVSFSQHLFASAAEASLGLQLLHADGNADVGKPGVLETDFQSVDQSVVSNLFGAPFAEQVFALPQGEWQGPVESGYGFHLVQINHHQAASLRPFEQVREFALNEWTRLQQEQAEQQYFDQLLKKYKVVVDDVLPPGAGQNWLSQVAK